jgi:glyoxylase-like metal-dependent hydrolase (beta-lactamase superfamily II)
MTSSLSVRVVGVGDAFTSIYYNACLLVESASTRLLIDAPPALARALADLGERGGERVRLDDIDHVLITHLHGDHVGGLEQLLFYRRFVTQRRAALFAIEGVLEGLWDTRLRGGMDTLLDPGGEVHRLSLEDYADVTPLRKGSATTLGDLSIEWRPTIHHIPTSALRIRAGGRVFGYSADTAFDPGLIGWLAESDLFLHETNFGVHTPIASLAALPREIRGRMRVIHYPDALDVETSPIPAAREGDRYAL